MSLLSTEQKDVAPISEEAGISTPFPAGSTRKCTQDDPAPAAETAYFTIETLATFLDVPRRTVQKWAMARRLPGMVRAGRLLRFERTAIQRAALSGSLLLPVPRNTRVTSSALRHAPAPSSHRRENR